MEKTTTFFCQRSPKTKQSEKTQFFSAPLIISRALALWCFSAINLQHVLGDEPLLKTKVFLTKEKKTGLLSSLNNGSQGWGPLLFSVGY